MDKNKEILDTPGILWPRFTSKETGLNLAIAGSIKDGIVDFREMALKVLEHLIIYYPENLKKTYNIEKELDDFVLNSKSIIKQEKEKLEKNEEVKKVDLLKTFRDLGILKKNRIDKMELYYFYLTIGEKLNIYIKGGEVDEERLSRKIVEDYRKGKFGRISLEFPESAKENG